MKLGQMASYLDQGLPSPVRAALADLRQDAPPMSAELAAGVLVAELGRAPRRAVRRMGPGPAGVGLDRPGPPGHHPRRPGRGGQGPVPGGGRGDPGRPGQRRPPLRRRRDAVPRPRPRRAGRRAQGAPGRGAGLPGRGRANQRLFVDYYRDHPFIRVPEVVDELSTGRVLTTELSAGARFDELADLEPGASATWPPRPSTASSSGRSTACTPSTVTLTPATTCSSPAGESPSWTSGWSSASPPTRSTSSTT